MYKLLNGYRAEQTLQTGEVIPISQFEMIRDFHVKFELEYHEQPPRALPDDYALFRLGFMIEELKEYADASGYIDITTALDLLHDDIKQNGDVHNANRSSNQDLEKQLDSLVDLVYVALGTSYLHGFNFDEAFVRVHMANMQKVRVLNVEESVKSTGRGSVYDVKKPKGWEPADLSDLVSKRQAPETSAFAGEHDAASK